MRANHSPLQFFGLIAAASVLVSGVYANAALAGTMASTTASSGASASPMMVGSSPASETGKRSSATPGQQLVQVTTPATPANPAPPTPASQATRVDIAVTPLVGGGNSAGAPTGARVPSATITTTAPTDPSPADSAAGRRVPIQLSARPAPASRPAATKLAATQPVAGAPPTSVPTVTHPVATSPSVAGLTVTQPVAAPPTATSRVATGLVATKRVATPSLRARSASLSPGRRTGRLHYLQTFVTQWLRAEKDQASRVVTPPDLPLSPAPGHPSWGVATGPLGPAIGSPRLAGDTELETGLASVAAAPRRPERAQKPPSVAPPRAATPPPIPQALSPAPPVQTRLPVGGAAAATGGGVGSVAPSVVAELQAIALALATILLVRFSLDRAMWRSTLLASRLEHPG